MLFLREFCLKFTSVGYVVQLVLILRGTINHGGTRKGPDMWSRVIDDINNVKLKKIYGISRFY